jgi:predicted Rossmann fold nucleotide-binding protein DprA/Smf involved in DNA uptake
MAKKKIVKPKTKPLAEQIMERFVASAETQISLTGKLDAQAVYTLINQGMDAATIAGHFDTTTDQIQAIVQTNEFADIMSVSNAARRAKIAVKALDVIEAAISNGDLATARWAAERLDPHFAADAKTRREARAMTFEKSIEEEARAVEDEIEALDERALVALAKAFK